MVRPFRAQSSLWTGTQGVALSARNAPLGLNTTAHPYCTGREKAPEMHPAVRLAYGLPCLTLAPLYAMVQVVFGGSLGWMAGLAFPGHVWRA